MNDLSTLKPAEYSNISQGLKRLEYRISKANTPTKLLDCLKLAKHLIDNWPLKSKMVWGVVSSSFKLRDKSFDPLNIYDQAEEIDGEILTTVLQTNVPNDYSKVRPTIWGNDYEK
jgi:hypothetical protein